MTNVVQMEDGREVDFGKRGVIKREIEITGEGAKRKALVRFLLKNGKIFEKEISMKDPLLMEMAAHGLSAKVGDSAAGNDVDDAAIAVEQTLKQLDDGVWRQRKKGAAKGMTDFLKALCIVKGADTPEAQEELRQKVMKLDDDVIATMRKMGPVAAELAKIRAEKAAARAAKAAEKAGEADESVGEALAAL